MTSQGNPQKCTPDCGYANPLNLEPRNLLQDSEKDSHLQKKIQLRTIMKTDKLWSVDISSPK